MGRNILHFLRDYVYVSAYSVHNDGKDDQYHKIKKKHPQILLPEETVICEIQTTAKTWHTLGYRIQMGTSSALFPGVPMTGKPL